VLLIVEVGVWRLEGCESGGVGDVVRGLFAKALVRVDVDPHCGGLGAREADDGVIVLEVRASALFECWNSVCDAVPSVADTAYACRARSGRM
jgi:hypothetical protein